jgi:DNA-binding beta-propeller fold protein YncE
VVAVAAAATVIILLGGGYFLIGGGGGGGTGGHTSGGGGTITPTIPGCTNSVASAKTSPVTSKSLTLGGKPYAVRVTPDRKFSFVTLGDKLAVLRNGSGLAPTLLHTLQVPGANLGEAFTKDGRYVLLAHGDGAQVLSVPEAEAGNVAVVGTLHSPRGRGAVQVTISPDGNFAFVTLQKSGGMAVFNLQQALASNFTQPSFVGIVPTGEEPVGIGISGDPAPRWLYVTSMRKLNAADPSEGFVSVVNLRKAEVSPARAVVSKVTAGCSPVRVMTSKDGKVVWVTARESDALLGFSAVKMRTDPKHSLIARVDVGEGPIGQTFVAQDSRIVVADSNYKSLSSAKPNVAVVSVKQALAHKPALLGVFKSGEVPRQFYAIGKRLLVTNFGSGQLQAVKIADLP